MTLPWWLFVALVPVVGMFLYAFVRCIPIFVDRTQQYVDHVRWWLQRRKLEDEIDRMGMMPYPDRNAWAMAKNQFMLVRRYERNHQEQIAERTRQLLDGMQESIITGQYPEETTLAQRDLHTPQTQFNQMMDTISRPAVVEVPSQPETISPSGDRRIEFNL